MTQCSMRLNTIIKLKLYGVEWHLPINAWGDPAKSVAIINHNAVQDLLGSGFFSLVTSLLLPLCGGKVSVIEVL